VVDSNLREGLAKHRPAATSMSDIRVTGDWATAVVVLTYSQLPPDNSSNVSTLGKQERQLETVLVFPLTRVTRAELRR
jgi:hypothetical protein